MRGAFTAHPGWERHRQWPSMSHGNNVVFGTWWHIGDGPGLVPGRDPEGRGARSRRLFPGGKGASPGIGAPHGHGSQTGSVRACTWHLVGSLRRIHAWVGFPEGQGIRVRLRRLCGNRRGDLAVGPYQRGWVGPEARLRHGRQRNFPGRGHAPRGQAGSPRCFNMGQTPVTTCASLLRVARPRTTAAPWCTASRRSLCRGRPVMSWQRAQLSEDPTGGTR